MATAILVTLLCSVGVIAMIAWMVGAFAQHIDGPSQSWWPALIAVVCFGAALAFSFS